MKIHILLIFFLCTFLSCKKASVNNSSQTVTNANYSAWNPPLGEEIPGGVVLYEGWSAPKLVASPVNYSQNGGWSDSVTVSRDGLNIYFGYTPVDYFIFESTQVMQATGPVRTVDQTTDAFQIYQAVLGSRGFTVTKHPANVSASVWAASQAVNSPQDLMAFVTFIFTPSYRTEIFLAQKNGATWNQLGALASPVNGTGHCNDDNPFVIGNLTSATVYFESKRNDLAGTTCGTRTRIFYSEFSNGTFSNAALVPGVNGAGAGTDDTDNQFAILENKQTAFWTSIRNNTYGIYTADWSGGTFQNVRPAMLLSAFAPPFLNKIVRIGEPSVAELPEGYIMYFTCGIALGDTVSNEPANIQMRICFSKKSK